MVPPAGTDLTVYDETSAVRWDGHGEQIVMSVSGWLSDPQCCSEM